MFDCEYGPNSPYYLFLFDNLILEGNNGCLKIGLDNLYIIKC